MPKRVPYHLYVLRCADGSLYTGITTDLSRRLREHNGEGPTRTAGARYTRARRPVELVYSRRFKDRSAASIEEARIKKLSRDEKLKLVSVQR